ncbi:hypothetical protein B0H19DRAFT_1071035 [Mycena capillaripes]|nr:hypothetical protein B0H19DRAFT_1071035 [Mycena capillaripes]
MALLGVLASGGRRCREVQRRVTAAGCIDHPVDAGGKAEAQRVKLTRMPHDQRVFHTPAYPMQQDVFAESVDDPAARRARRAGSTGPVRRVADPFRQGFWKFFDGTVTGRLFKVTAVGITAVDGGSTGDGFWHSNRRISHSSNIFRAFI